MVTASTSNFDSYNDIRKGVYEFFSIFLLILEFVNRTFDDEGQATSKDQANEAE